MKIINPFEIAFCVTLAAICSALTCYAIDKVGVMDWIFHKLPRVIGMAIVFIMAIWIILLFMYLSIHLTNKMGLF